MGKCLNGGSCGADGVTMVAVPPSANRSDAFLQRPKRAGSLFGGGDRDALGRLHGVNHFAQEREELLAPLSANRLS